MGKGDKKTFRGKVFKGSYGKTRLHHPQKRGIPKTKTAAARKTG